MRRVRRRLSLSFLALGLLWVAGAACTQDVCEEAYDKMQSCVEQLNCNKLDPVERDRCEKARKAWAQYSGNRSAYLLACSNDSKIRTEAEKVVDCALDPRTCTCP